MAEGPSEGSGVETLVQSLWEPSYHMLPCSSVKRNPGTEPPGDGRGSGGPRQGLGKEGGDRLGVDAVGCGGSGATGDCWPISHG